MDPVAELRQRLQDLFDQVRRPTYRTLERHADLSGRPLRVSTISNLLNGPTTPRWETVESFLRACGHYARAQRIRLNPDLSDVDHWHKLYRDMEKIVADRETRDPNGGPAAS